MKYQHNGYNESEEWILQDHAKRTNVPQVMCKWVGKNHFIKASLTFQDFSFFFYYYSDCQAFQLKEEMGSLSDSSYGIFLWFMFQRRNHTYFNGYKLKYQYFQLMLPVEKSKCEEKFGKTGCLAWNFSANISILKITLSWHS